MKRLWAAEVHPAYGHWIFARLETTADGFTMQCCYDSRPAWMNHDGISGPWRGHLSKETAVRAPEVRPAWAVLLASEVAYTGPPEPFADLGTD